MVNKMRKPAASTTKVKNVKKVMKVMKVMKKKVMKVGNEPRCIDYQERTWSEWCDYLLDEYKDYKATEESYLVRNRRTGRLGFKILYSIVFFLFHELGSLFEQLFFLENLPDLIDLFHTQKGWRSIVLNPLRSIARRSLTAMGGGR